MTSLRLTAALLVAAIALTACDSGAPAPAPTGPTQPAAPAPRGVQPLSASLQHRAAVALEKAKGMADKAYAHLEAGQRVEQAESFNAAIPHYQQAKPLFKKALQEIEPFIEPELGDVTAEQVERFCGEYVAVTRKWQKAIASMGKVPPK